MKTLIITIVTALAASLAPQAAFAENPPHAGARLDVEGDAVARGAYLSTAANCMTCHTAADGEPYAGGVAVKTEFGVIYSSNITQDSEAGIGSWTEKQFIRAMRKGKAASGANLYPAFPYTHFSKLSEQDISDIYAYIQTVQPSSYAPPKNTLGFPHSQRWLMGVWNMLNSTSGEFQPNPDKSAEWNRGAYLVEGLAHCGACHTPRGPLGGSKEKLALSGGTYLDEVPGGEVRQWAAVNLTPAPDGLGAWTAQDIVDYLSTGYSAKGDSFGPMNKVIEHGTSKLHPDDIKAMAVYLKDLPPIVRASQHEMDRSEFSKADVLYTVHCGTCHLPTGLGDTVLGPPLKGSSIVQAADPSALINVIIYGAEGPATLDGFNKREKKMKAFKDLLNDEEIALISTYLRSNWGNYGGPVHEKDVAKQR